MIEIQRAATRLVGCLLLLILCAPVLAQPPGQGQDPDWPCPQVLVPEVSAAVVWAGPPVEGLDWRGDAEVAALVRRVSDAGTAQEEAERAVSGFAGAQTGGQKDARLTLLFAGVLEFLNKDRAHLIDGIKRYSRDQAHRAEVIGQEIDALVRLEQDGSEMSAAKAAELRKRMAVEERVFDARERSIRFLCRRPVAVEERLGRLARMIAGQMDG
ncbi:hypothetical protein [Thiorhodococcus minor]|uniref:Uncharacterized protein n=1 Tax=Thiorhodococcus minor TaxID=57489 RepID=A0A6M0K1U9_9GAMM|nr:hypothetical protein [Thiorhodococcus minor]NEV63726.1 hypothetical protein [Thiorhodococcus minor]